MRVSVACVLMVLTPAGLSAQSAEVKNAALARGFARRQYQLQQVPLFITQIRRIHRVFHPASLADPLGQKPSHLQKNNFSDTLL